MPQQHTTGSFPDFLSRLGRRIRELRRSRGWSQERLAHTVGISRTFMGTVELGQKQASLWTIYRMARALGVSPAEVFVPAAGDRESTRDLIARLESRLCSPRRTAAQLRKIADLVDAYLGNRA